MLSGGGGAGGEWPGGGCQSEFEQRDRTRGGAHDVFLQLGATVVLDVQRHPVHADGYGQEHEDARDEPGWRKGKGDI